MDANDMATQANVQTIERFVSRLTKGVVNMAPAKFEQELEAALAHAYRLGYEDAHNRAKQVAIKHILNSARKV